MSCNCAQQCPCPPWPLHIKLAHEFVCAQGMMRTYPLPRLRPRANMSVALPQLGPRGCNASSLPNMVMLSVPAGVVFVHLWPTAFWMLHYFHSMSCLAAYGMSSVCCTLVARRMLSSVGQVWKASSSTTTRHCVHTAARRANQATRFGPCRSVPKNALRSCSCAALFLQHLAV